MNFFKHLAVAGVLVLAACASQSPQTTTPTPPSNEVVDNCIPGAVAAQLMKAQGFYPVFAGQDDAGDVTMAFVSNADQDNPETAWALVVNRADGTSCLQAHGTEFQLFDVGRQARIDN